MYHVQRCNLLWKMLPSQTLREFLLNAQTYNAEDIVKIGNLRENIIGTIGDSSPGARHANKFDKGTSATSGRSNITMNVDGLDDRQVIQKKERIFEKKKKTK